MDTALEPSAFPYFQAEKASAEQRRMGKGKRNRERRQQESRERERGEVAAAEMVVPGSPRAKELMEERIKGHMALVNEIQTPADLAAAIEKRIAAVEEASQDYDALHVLANFCFANLPAHPDAYVESEEEGSASQVELLAAIFLRRKSRKGAGKRLLPIGKEILDAVRQPLQELLGLLTFDGFSSALKGAKSLEEAGVRARSATHSLHLHAPGFHWQQKAAIKALFSEEKTAEALKDRLGFDAESGLACTEALEKLINKHFAAKGEQSRSAAQEAREGTNNDAVKWVRKMFGEHLSDEQVVALVATAWTFHDWGDVLAFDASEIAEQSGVTEEEARHYLEAFSIGFGEVDARLRTGAEEVRLHPFIPIENGRYQLSFPGNALWALQPFFESTLKKIGGRTWQRYQAQRASWVEKRAAELLQEVLRPDLVALGTRYSIEQPEAAEGEIDVLLRLGDTLLILEAKGATVGGRRGGQRLIDQLQKVLTKAATQASAAKQALDTGDNVRLYKSNGQPLDLGIDQAREIHPLVVTLDDLSVVAPNLWELEGSRLLPEGVATPWVVNLHELELICGLVEHPTQFVHFLRRRSRLNQLGDRVASDELDWWMLYLQNSLYMEEEGKLDHQVRYASLTDPLDAYYFYLHGERTEPAPKPAQAIETQLEEVLNFLDEHRPPGFVAAACDLLDISSQSRESFFEEMQEKREVAAKRDRVQRGTLGFTEGMPGGMILGFVTVPDGHGPELPIYLRQFAEERLAEHKPERLLVLGVETSSPRPLDALVVVEPRVWRLPQAA
jgi:hypothetical protein